MKMVMIDVRVLANIDENKIDETKLKNSLRKIGSKISSAKNPYYALAKASLCGVAIAAYYSKDKKLMQAAKSVFNTIINLD